MKNTNTSKKDKVLNYLTKPGKSITETQARSRFGLKNLRATISDLREEGQTFTLVKKIGKETKYKLA
jgi:hypothetical protein